MKFWLCLHLIIFSCTSIASSQIDLFAGAFKSDTFNSAAQYSIQYEKRTRSDLGIHIGLQAMQSSIGNSDMTQLTLPYAGIKQYFKLNQLPFKLYAGGGFSVNHIPSEYGSNYIGTHLNGGLLYIAGNGAHIIFDYKQLYGKTRNDGNPYSFNGAAASIGIGMHLKTKKQKKSKAADNNSTIHRSQQPIRSRRPSPNGTRGPKSKQQKEAIRQAQKAMDGMSWPTY
jgi:hypothetical protein